LHSCKESATAADAAVILDEEEEAAAAAASDDLELVATAAVLADVMGMGMMIT
jgi:hypothetical protein